MEFLKQKRPHPTIWVFSCKIQNSKDYRKVATNWFQTNWLEKQKATLSFRDALVHLNLYVCRISYCYMQLIITQDLLIVLSTNFVRLLFLISKKRFRYPIKYCKNLQIQNLLHQSVIDITHLSHFFNSFCSYQETRSSFNLKWLAKKETLA